MSLINTLNSAKAELKPLPKHYLANNGDAHLREQYATLLGAVITDNGSVSPYQSAYFADLLKSMGLAGEASQYLTASQKLDKSNIVQLVKQLDKSAHIALLFDIIILLRIDSPFTSQQTELANAVADVFEMSKDDVAMASFWAGMALGVMKDKDLSQKNLTKLSKTVKIKVNLDNEFEFLYQPLGFLVKGAIIAKGNEKPELIELLVKNIFDLNGLGSSDLNNADRPIKSLHHGYLVCTDIIQKSEELLLNEVFEYQLIILPSSLQNWSEFFSEVYPAQLI